MVELDSRAQLKFSDDESMHESIRREVLGDSLTDSFVPVIGYSARVLYEYSLFRI